MSLLQKIRTDLDQARRDRNQQLLTILVTVYSEATMVGKTKRNGESTDDEVTSVLRKFKEGVLEIEKIKSETPESVFEKAVYDGYLPTMLTTEELTMVIQNLVDQLSDRTPKQMGVIMGKLKSEYLGKYDGNIASQITKSLLA